ncbi:MAG TPA: hypothetical protein VMB03_00725 [Bryobacteraceae bacterium]|nr:hypothetical protein [Bryobacteraceae bacterium]
MVGLALMLVFLSAIASAEARCPWLNAATAGGVLGGSVEMSVTATSCEFTRSGALLRIEVASASAKAAHCGAGAEALRGIGNQAFECAYQGQPGWTGQQVVGRVRDQAFVVRIAAADRGMAKSLRENVRKVAEQVAGILF